MLTRKVGFLLPLLVVFTLLLAACSGGKSTKTPSPTAGLPNTGGTAAATQPIPSGGGAVSTAPAVGATVGATSAPAGTAGASAPGANSSDPARVSNFMKLQIKDKSGNQLGSVSNVVINLSNLRIADVILSSGGFLGVGQKLFPIPWNEFSLDPACQAAFGASSSGISSIVAPGSTTATPGAGSGSASIPASCNLVFNADTNALKNAPTIASDGLKNLTPGWDTQYYNYWLANGVSTGNSGLGIPSTPATEEVSVTEEITSTETSGEVTNPFVEGTPTVSGLFILGSDLLGMNVLSGSNMSSPGTGGTGSGGPGIGVSSNPLNGTPDPTLPAFPGTVVPGQSVGTVTDGVVSLSNQNLSYLIVVGNGASNLSNNLYPLPAQLFSFDIANKNAILNVSAVALASAPNFAAGKLPNTSTPGWDQAISAYWQNYIGFNTGAPVTESP